MISFTSLLWSPDSSAPCQNILVTCNSTCQLARLGVEPRNNNDVNEVQWILIITKYDICFLFIQKAPASAFCCGGHPMNFLQGTVQLFSNMPVP